MVDYTTWTPRCQHPQCFAAQEANQRCTLHQVQVQPTPKPAIGSIIKGLGVAAALTAGVKGLQQYMGPSSHEGVFAQKAKPRRLALGDWLQLDHQKCLLEPVPPHGLPLADVSNAQPLTFTNARMYGYIPQWNAMYCGHTAQPGTLKPQGDAMLWTTPLTDSKTYALYAKFQDGRFAQAYRVWSQTSASKEWTLEPEARLPPALQLSLQTSGRPGAYRGKKKIMRSARRLQRLQGWLPEAAKGHLGMPRARDMDRRSDFLEAMEDVRTRQARKYQDDLRAAQAAARMQDSYPQEETLPAGLNPGTYGMPAEEAAAPPFQEADTRTAEEGVDHAQTEARTQARQEAAQEAATRAPAEAKEVYEQGRVEPPSVDTVVLVDEEE
jgi:hypothetical protein